MKKEITHCRISFKIYMKIIKPGAKSKVKTPVVTVTPPSKSKKKTPTKTSSTKLNNDTSNVIVTSTSKTKKHIDADLLEKKTSLAGKIKLIVFTYLKVIILL